MVNMFEGLEGYIPPGSEEEALVRRLDVSRLPRHVAVIMDGNGRWARERGLSRIEGHKAGSDSVSEIVEASARLGIKVLSLFAFSKENWKRPPQEVSRLWSLLKDYSEEGRPGPLRERPPADGHRAEGRDSAGRPGRARAGGGQDEG